MNGPLRSEIARANKDCSTAMVDWCRQDGRPLESRAHAWVTRNLTMGIARISWLILVVAAGCGRTSSNAPLPAEQLPAAVNATFENASPEVQRAAAEIADLIRNRDDAEAFLALQNLSARSDLTSEQRETAARSVRTLNERLQAAAASGNQRAAEVVQIYRSGK